MRKSLLRYLTLKSLSINILSHERRVVMAFAAMLFLFPSGLLAADFQGASHLTPFDEKIINYSQTDPAGPIARLRERIESGEVTLAFDEETGYLPALLDLLNIPNSSQMLVFSKTSLQRERISPANPRAVFFNETCYVGYIPGAPLLEITSVDPELGAVFYSLKQEAQRKPEFIRTDQCLECHASSKSLGVPGHLVRSFKTDEAGVVDFFSGISPITHETPLEERWGGWYVTGKHGTASHLGNLVGEKDFDRHENDPGHGGNVTDLSSYFSVDKYPVGTSDIVALMVLEHQTYMHNFITRLHYEARLRLAQYGHIDYVKEIAEAFLQYLLFSGEAPLPDAIEGKSGFARWFEGQGPKDPNGRSLRTLNLKTRLFQYPCSYLVYSDAFEQLPDPIKQHLYERLWEILYGRDKSPAFAHLKVEDKRAIREILVATKADLPDYWR